MSLERQNAESRASSSPKRFNALNAVWTIARKDWRIEGRARDVLTATLFFAGIVVLIMGLAFSDPDRRIVGQAVAPGVLWIAIAFASVLAAGRAFAAEAEDGALEALLLYPVPHELVYLGKLLGNFALMLVLTALIAPLVMLIFGLELHGRILEFAATLVLGTLGFSIITVFHSAITVNLRARESMLPVLIFPIVVPVVLGTIKATGLIVTDGPAADVGAWLRLIAGFDAIYVVVCTLAFPFAVEN